MHCEKRLSLTKEGLFLLIANCQLIIILYLCLKIILL
nr:MAG TPA: hypothetical protein [Caudoviricetes sp.]